MQMKAKYLSWKQKELNKRKEMFEVLSALLIPSNRAVYCGPSKIPFMNKCSDCTCHESALKFRLAARNLCSGWKEIELDERRTPGEINRKRESGHFQWFRN